MNYSTLIQNRKSTREYSTKRVSDATLEDIKTYYENSVARLIPEIKTELLICDESIKESLEGAAGYNDYLIGASQYLILLSEKGELSEINAGYIMEDLVLKLTEMDLGTCWITFTDSDKVKASLQLSSKLDIAAIVAFGYGIKTTKRLRLNILSMSNIDICAKRHYFDPKKSISDLVFIDRWGNTENVEDTIGFYDEMLWEALYAASLSPSYLNRQAYGFILHDGQISLIQQPDSYNTKIDGDLSLGIVLLHFSATAAQWAGKIDWKFGADAAKLELPEGYNSIATCKL